MHRRLFELVLVYQNCALLQLLLADLADRRLLRLDVDDVSGVRVPRVLVLRPHSHDVHSLVVDSLLVALLEVFNHRVAKLPHKLLTPIRLLEPPVQTALSVFLLDL